MFNEGSSCHITIYPNKEGVEKFNVSINLTFISTYFTQVYKSTTPWQHPIIIINILEYLKLILEAVVTKDMYVLGEVYTELNVEEEAANMTPNTWKENMDPLLQNKECITKRSRWHFILNNVNHQLRRRLLQDGWMAVHHHLYLPWFSKGVSWLVITLSMQIRQIPAIPT